MTKKKMKVSMDPVPAVSFLVGDEARARFKHECLLQDYLELLRETEEKRKKLREALQKKLILLAEVKFLTKKYSSLSNGTRATPFNMKKKAHKVVLPPKEIDKPRIPLIHGEMPSKERNRQSKEVSVQRAPKLLDLNHVYLPNSEEMESFEVEWEPLQVNKMKSCLPEVDAMANDIKVSVCRDMESGSSRVGKRKISWQDIALRV